jgi:hypothetical protein
VALAMLGAAVGAAVLRVLGDGTEVVEPSGEGVADLQRFAEVIRVQGILDGAAPPASPTALAEEVDLVVIGTIEGFRPGRVNEDDPFGLVPLVTMDVHVDRLVRGVLPDGSDEVVHVELGVFGIEDGTTPESLAAVAPTGAVVLYLSGPAPGYRAGSLPLFTDPDAGRPEGQPLWWPAAEHGFYAERVDGGMSDLSGMATPGESRHLDARLEEVLPPADRWP